MSKHVKEVRLRGCSVLAPIVVDWSRCCLCQSSNNKNLICPANNPNSKELHAGYSSLAAVLESLGELNLILPSGQHVNNLDQGDGIYQTLIKN